MQKIVYGLITIASVLFYSGTEEHVSFPKEFSGFSKEDILNLSTDNIIGIFIILVIFLLIFSAYRKVKNTKRKISFHLPFSSFVTISLIDSKGQEVDTILNDVVKSGLYEFNIDFNYFKRGIYYYHIKAQNEDRVLEKTIRFVVAK